MVILFTESLVEAGFPLAERSICVARQAIFYVIEILFVAARVGSLWIAGNPAAESCLA